MADRNELTISGRFEHEDGTPIPGAAVHETFLGDPPTNCGTWFDLENASMHTDESGQFRATLTRLQLERQTVHWGEPDIWRTGCFLILAVKDARTIGYVIATGDELAQRPIRLTALPPADITGVVLDEQGHPVEGAKVEVEYYLLFVGRGPYPNAPVNFWLSRPSRQPGQSPERVADLAATTGPDGGFVIPNAPAMPGELRLGISHPDYACLETAYYPFQPTMRLVMEPAAAANVRVALPNGKPAVGFHFHLEGVPDGESRATHRRGTTDESGRCELGQLRPGSYKVRYLGGAQEPWAVPVLVIPNLARGEQREIALTAQRGSVLCGRVLEADSESPILHAEVRFESESYPATASTYQAAYTDASGVFEFPYAVAPGRLDVFVSRHERGRSFGRRQTVLVGNEPRTEVTFYLDQNGK